MASDPPHSLRAHNAPDDARAALAEMTRVALPAVVTMLSYAVMQFVDKIFVGQLSPEALAAAGNGGVASMVPAALSMGMLAVINTYVSQNLGAGMHEKCSQYAWNGLWLSCVFWLFWLLPCAAALPWIFEAMRSIFGLTAVSPQVQEMESVYGRILLVGMLLTLAARSTSHFFFGVHRPMVVMLATLAGNAVNLVLTYALVFGALGLPAWGVAGAAVATVIGSGVEAAIPMAVFLSPSYARAFATRRNWRLSGERLRDIVRLGWPGAAMWGNEMICWWIFMSGYVASFDAPGAPAVHNPAAWVAHQYIVLSFMPAMGLSIGVTAIVGKSVGMGRPDLALRRTWLGVRLAMVYMGVCAVAMVVFRRQLVLPFLPEDALPEQAAMIVDLGSKMLILTACFQLFDALAVQMSGALRGAGDTVWPGVATLILSWVVILGGGWTMTRLAPGLESLGPWIAAASYVILLSLALLGRFLSGRWKDMAVVEPNPARSPADAGEGLAPACPAQDVMTPDVTPRDEVVLTAPSPGE